ncbi:hypothetical protein O181_059578 [Austropuccinia psidii MF-1]|uniref:Uncharacterized protein n=1 Tax=Austropuccinia psidii MF-1 TaxID=1389203 RepID=A0A9Q3HWM7_9BASI|nr:hypothetical protein [Austropuccinia psidii MF-1]
MVIHFNNILYSFNSILPSGPFFNLHIVLKNFVRPWLYNLLLNLTPQNPPPDYNDKPYSPNSNNHLSSAATTSPNLPIDPTLSSNPIAEIYPFFNSNALSPPPFAPNIPAASPAMPYWIKSYILTPPLPPTLDELNIIFGYYFFLFDAEMNQLDAKMHLFCMTPPAYNIFCDAHNIIMASFCSIVLWYT